MKYPYCLESFHEEWGYVYFGNTYFVQECRTIFGQYLFG